MSAITQVKMFVIIHAFFLELFPAALILSFVYELIINTKLFIFMFQRD